MPQASGIHTVYVIFKTHLDVGFTGLARNVLKKYYHEFIPQAIDLAKTLRQAGGDARFVWTTGSYLIQGALENMGATQRRNLELAIEAGDIRWHALPFTTHTELMDVPLFEYGLSLSQKLDARFGKQTIAAKMTDVPGHTIAMLPLLKKAGVELLHIGVNDASTMPDTPPMFRWQNGADTINVIYCQGYGEFTPIGNTGTALYFAHTHDNQGCQRPREIQSLFAKLKRKYPGANIVAADLNDVALEMRKIQDGLPIIRQEIGDSWIHGVGSDPEKVSAFRGCLRLRDTLSDKDKDTLNRGLILVPEHTWGLDEKHFLHDHRHFSREKFEKLRKTKRAQWMERSWQEQRNFLYNAMDQLEAPQAKAAAQKIRDDVRRAPADTAGATPVNAYDMLKINGFTVQVNRRGIIKHLSDDSRTYADDAHILGRVIYEQFCKADYDRFFSQYNVYPYLWAKEDFQKIGIHRGTDRYRQYKPNLDRLFQKENTLIAQFSFPEEAYEKYGCPKSWDVIITFTPEEVTFDYAYFEKPANRIAEALWIKFNPIDTKPRVSKLGQDIDPTDVVKNGNNKLFATDYGVHYDTLSLELRDSALVAFGSPSLLDFNNDTPKVQNGVWCNLYNNTWGTNFGMWHEGDMRYRFVLHIK